MKTGYQLVLDNGNRLRFHAAKEAGEANWEKAMGKAYEAATKDRQRWYASEQFPGRKIAIVAGIG